MTPSQTDLARHALGLPNKQRKSYRNHFCTGPDTSDYIEWMAMVEQGMATMRKGTVLSGGDDIFYLTEVGARLALKPRENLDEEDFPNEQRAA